MPYETQGAARDAIYGFMMTGLGLYISTWVNPIIVFDDKQEPQPPITQIPYMRAQLRHTGRTQVTVGGAGGRRFRSKFQLTMKVYTWMGRGMDDYSYLTVDYPGQDTICDALLHVFEGSTTGTDAAQFYQVRRLEYGEDEGRYRSTVIASGDYDTVR